MECGMHKSVYTFSVIQQYQSQDKTACVTLIYSQPT